jgi:hypothetical protein
VLPQSELEGKIIGLKHGACPMEDEGAGEIVEAGMISEKNPAAAHHSRARVA